jgi:hypothetical protein
MTSIGLRLGAVAALAFLLCGCNMVVSPTPVFTADDAKGAPQMKPGLWAGPEPDCSFDEKTPASTWPKCANGSIATATDFRGTDPTSKPSPYVFAAGDPRILQAQADFNPGKGSDTTITQKGSLYVFLAVKPLASDGDGRITSIEAWFIQCGEPPPKPPEGKDFKPEDYVTKHPLPGLKVDGGMCTPSGKDAVRGAAKASRAWAGDQILHSHWVRDGDK